MKSQFHMYLWLLENLNGLNISKMNGVLPVFAKGTVFNPYYINQDRRKRGGQGAMALPKVFQNHYSGGLSSY